MKTKTIYLIFLILLYSSGISSQTNRDNNSEIFPDPKTPLENLTLQQIRDAVYGVPYYNIETKQTMISGGTVPIMRSADEMKKVAENPALFVDSLFYEDILDAPLADYRDIFIERFPFLIFWNVSASFELMSVIDSLEIEKPCITAGEYWEILRRDHAALINKNFERINNAGGYILKHDYPYSTIADVRKARRTLMDFIIPIKRNFYPETKPYLEKLGITPDPEIFVIPRCAIVGPGSAMSDKE